LKQRFWSKSDFFSIENKKSQSHLTRCLCLFLPDGSYVLTYDSLHMRHNTFCEGSPRCRDRILSLEIDAVAYSTYCLFSLLWCQIEAHKLLNNLLIRFLQAICGIKETGFRQLDRFQISVTSTVWFLLQSYFHRKSKYPQFVFLSFFISLPKKMIKKTKKCGSPK